jgi:hypothetical protein
VECMIVGSINVAVEKIHRLYYDLFSAWRI